MRTDQELLADYAATGSEAAFAELASRHGRMVYRSCLRLLGNEHDAEEAAQAVFLVLVRERRSLRSVTNPAAWLHGVAGNVARLAIRSRARRSRHEAEAAMAREAGDGGRGTGAEAGRVEALAGLDRELAALPAAQRQAVLLRYLEDHSVEEAARIAGCPPGTLGWRASEGLERLRQRLAQRGAVLALPGLAALLGAEAAASVPVSLLPSILAASKLAATGAAAGAAGTGAGASALADGVLKMMFWAKVKVAAAVAAAVLAVGGGGGALAARLLAAEPAVPKAPSPMPNADSGVVEKGLSCQVTALPGGGKVALSAGSEQGLKPGFELDVERDGKKVAVLKVVSVGPKTATAELVSATGELKVGDRAATRFKEVGQIPAEAPGDTKPLVFTEKDNGRTVRVPVGQVFEIRLEGKEAGTGWEFPLRAVRPMAIAFPGDREAVLWIEKGDFLPLPGAADQAIGTYVARYKAAKAGEAVVEGSYVRPGGPGAVERLKTALRGTYKLTVEVVAAPPAAGEAVGGLRLAMASRKPQCRVGDAWELDVRAINLGANPLALDLYRKTLGLQVVGPAGPIQPVRATIPPPAVVFPAKEASWFRIVNPEEAQSLSAPEPGAPTVCVYPASDKGDGRGGWPPIPAGEYRVKVIFDNPGPDDTAKYGVKAKEWIGTATSNEVVIRVLPPEGAGAEKPPAGAPDEATARKLAIEYLGKRTSDPVKIMSAGLSDNGHWLVQYVHDKAGWAMPPGGYPRLWVSKATGEVKEKLGSAPTL